MDQEFFTLSHDSFDQPRFVWAKSIVGGLSTDSPCAECGGSPSHPEGTVTLFLDPDKGSVWPDVLGCGAYPLLILRERALDSFEEFDPFPKHPIRIQEPLPNGLGEKEAPQYSWLDGRRMRGALLDFERSGFVDVRFCSRCGRRMHDVAATYQRQQEGAWPYRIKPESWDGSDLFTTDLSPTSFFCTSRVLSIARARRLLNFRFEPAEDGKHAEPVPYLDAQLE